MDYRASRARSGRTCAASGAAQGGSTITQQFVKNALAAQSNRTVFQKLREAALAYQLERKWSKEKILTEYLNTVYFGERRIRRRVRRAHVLRRSPAGLRPAGALREPSLEPGGGGAARRA